MKKKYMIVAICIVSFLVGVLSGQLFQAAVKNGEAAVGEEKSASWESKVLEPVISGLENTEECYLCGRHNRSLMPYFRKFDDLGIICLNTWYVLDMQIRNHDEEGNLIGEKGHTSSGYTGTGKNSCFFERETNPERGISEVSVRIGAKSYFDIKNVKDHLCQKCLDKILESLKTYGPEGESAKPYDLCVVDFQTLEVYPLQEHNLGYTIRDYYVHIDHGDHEVKVMAIYAPVLENSKKENVL